MGVCTEERPVMHWQQSARFLGPSARDKSQTSPGGQRRNSGGAPVISNKHPVFRSCSSRTGICDLSSKLFGSAYNEPFRSYEEKTRPFDESAIKYSISSIQTHCPDSENYLGITLKSEAYISPSSTESTNETTLTGPDDCGHCGRFIQDRFYLSAVEKRWHVGCLQCNACKQPLDHESSCYSRDGNIYCKNDYYRLFGTRRCSRCLASISSSELVMRARNLVFHVSCFCCAVCNTPLSKGDQFGIRDSLIYCRTHFGITMGEDTRLTRFGRPVSYVSQFGSPPNDSSSPHDLKHIVPSNLFVPTTHVVSGLSQPPRQKGRPRKRKPKEIEALTSNIDLNTEYLDFGRGSHMSASSRTKRMRTSFKHHQLRTMKSYFSVNHNPDAKDLKQLSQKTGLPKRVLQVWFQNARAKWRRMMMKHDGSNLNEKGDGALDLDSFSTQSPSSFMISTNSPSHQNLE